MNALKVSDGALTVLVIKESLLQSIVADIVTFIMVLALCSIGIWLDSGFLKFIGGCMAIVYLLISSVKTKTNEVTPDQAIDIINKKFRKKGSVVDIKV